MSLETMTKLSTVTVGAGGVSSVSFSNIPQTYTDLVVRVSARSTRNNATYPVDNLNIAFNGTSAGVSVQQRNLYTYEATGSQIVASSNDTYLNNFMIKADGGTASTFGGGDIYISNYTSFNYKAISLDSVAPNNSTKAWLMLNAGVSLNTAPITSIEMFAASGNLVQYSTFTLYGVKSMRAASGNSIKATGGSINFDGTYVTHTFNTSGSFTPTTNLLVDYLVIAGGGGGGSSNNSGGGGAGGLRSTVTATGGGGSLEAALSLTGGNGYTVTIGAGGAGGVGSNVTGTSGSNSVFSSITSTGGGGGGGENSNGAAGGSSGGGGYNGNAGTRTASPVQGNNGANGSLSSPFPAGGGGGAGAAGNGAQGGNGQTISITGSSITYGGGGSGGRSSTPVSGGTGGGGSGGQNGGTAPTAGTVNLGGGGGGGAVHSGAAGGSGIVIIRYKG